MSLLLPSIVSNTTRTQQPFVLLQSSLVQSCTPLLRYAITQTKSKVLVFCLLHPPSSLVEGSASDEQLEVVDLTDRIPGYSDLSSDVRENILRKVEQDASGSATIVIDSVDTLVSNLGSLSATQVLLKRLLAIVLSKGGKSRLIVHMLVSSPLRDVLAGTSFSSTLTSLTAHPPALIKRVAAEYMTPPPPLSTPEKFWGIFLPISQRQHESEKLMFGPEGEGCQADEMVVEVMTRGADGSGRRRGIDRVLEGWSIVTNSACELRQLSSLSAMWQRKPSSEPQSAPDPTQDVSFNLNLTPQQQESRSQVPLPYTLEAKAGVAVQQAAIFYDPDSADDIDDDDPDEDLDI